MSFEKAVADSKKLTAKPSNEELLDLYGATQGRRGDRPPLNTVLTVAQLSSRSPTARTSPRPLRPACST